MKRRRHHVAPSPESLENRVFLSATVTTVYTESNNPAVSQNAVLAFHENSNGSLTQIGTFPTHGTGLKDLPPNTLPALGPDDSSTELVKTPDGRFLFAVNEGSISPGNPDGSVSAFRISSDGSLVLIGLFDSGGVEPDSLGLAGNNLYVSNRGTSTFVPPAGPTTIGTVIPNITGFRIGAGGTLTPIPHSTVSFDPGASPSQNLISPNGKLLFADIFAVPHSTSPVGNTLAPYQIESNGTLQPSPGGPIGAPVPEGTPPLLLGASFNPTAPIIYVGVAAANSVAVFTYTPSGTLTYVSETPVTGHITCWSTVSADGKYLYTGDNATDSVGVFSLANPTHPVEIQEFSLADAGAAGQTKAFQVSLSPDGHTLYAMSQSQTAAYPNGNQLTALSVAANGMVSEPNGPVILSTAGVPGDAQPQGLVEITSQAPQTGVSTVGSVLYIVGGLNTNDTVNVTAHGGRVYVQGKLNGANVSTSFSNTITEVRIVAYDGADNIVLGNGLNVPAVITAGKGNDVIQLGNSSYDSLILGNGNDHVQLGNGSHNSLLLGNGNDRVQLGEGSHSSVLMGSGNDYVQLGDGSYNGVTVGNGNDQVKFGDGSFSTALLGNGNDIFNAGTGIANYLTLGDGDDSVMTGTGWTVS